MGSVLQTLIIFTLVFSSIYFKNISIDSHSKNHSYTKIISAIPIDQRESNSSASGESISKFSSLFYIDDSSKKFTKFISKIKINVLTISAYFELKNFYVYIFSGVSPPSFA